ncbi:type II toxin-antitoxin system prevent-host-death family antitoxin [Candidatus Falkowbacteria bacterium]|nr:type II toxin-antitoxin system prevent-host-death family antitoxin [Candidatus Falkowbacteria bacterium]
MNIKKILSLTDARKNIFKIIEEMDKNGCYYALTERGKAKAVLMPVEMFESWRETLETVADFPELDNDLKKADEDIDKKNYITLDEVLARKGYVLADKPKEKYVSNSAKHKSSSNTRKTKGGRKS